MENRLIIKNINFVYQKRKILDNLSFSSTNGVVALVGNHDVGKTTLINIIVGLKKPLSGEIIFNNKNLLKDFKFISKYIGYLPQNFNVYNEISGYDFLAYVCDVKGVRGKEKKLKIENLIEEFNLYENIENPIGTYSSEFKRKLGIAQAMIGNSQLIIMDNPMVGLTEQGKLDFKNYFSHKGKDKIILIATNCIKDVESFCDQILIMKDSKVSLKK
ncbi:ATP-binding cassette domain-containing protein [Hathewaya limosa]|uniref:ABC-type multidrug transport system ATPase subunit n=1 Tax=Hathewaya limosa TaxID=1536 RepID=A0ABU0JSY1_HATLI|nr:ATP-binding cassette domain-containing protein [Hathewaya limosa]AWZ47850.1 ABC transporter ATP-binding protein [Clostridiaceae bacterium 14S0207]MDQ0479037.1 ABC-type multidrug transport system ATPase subunit [Hathewaya limosa]